MISIFAFLDWIDSEDLHTKKFHKNVFVQKNFFGSRYLSFFSLLKSCPLGYLKGSTFDAYFLVNSIRMRHDS